MPAGRRFTSSSVRPPHHLCRSSRASSSACRAARATAGTSASVPRSHGSGNVRSGRLGSLTGIGPTRSLALIVWPFTVLRLLYRASLLSPLIYRPSQYGYDAGDRCIERKLAIEIRLPIALQHILVFTPTVIRQSIAQFIGRITRPCSRVSGRCTGRRTPHQIASGVKKERRLEIAGYRLPRLPAILGDGFLHILGHRVGRPLQKHFESAHAQVARVVARDGYVHRIRG